MCVDLINFLLPNFINRHSINHFADNAGNYWKLQISYVEMRKEVLDLLKSFFVIE